MQKKLIAQDEVLEIIRKTCLCVQPKDDMITAVYNLPRRHEAEQGEGLADGLRYELKMGTNICAENIERIISHYTAKPTEPLAVLADSRGAQITFIAHYRGPWEIGIRINDEGDWIQHEFGDYDYALAEAKARAYLMALEDKKEIL